MPKKEKKKGKKDEKAENLCKICLQTVTNKTGLQCQGACAAWVHYECLNYTPGKIQDIENGLITVTCPCPDCKYVPKEVIETPICCRTVPGPAIHHQSGETPVMLTNQVQRVPNWAASAYPDNFEPRGQTFCCNYNTPNTYQSPPEESCIQGYPQKPFNMDNSMNETNYRVATVACGEGGVSQDAVTPSVPIDVVQQMCKAVGDLAQQLNFLMESCKFGQEGG